MTTRARPTTVGWIALGLSILAVALLVVVAWSFNLAISKSAGNRVSGWVVLWPWSFLADFAAFVAAIVVDIVAGSRGFGNRILGIVGGAVMLSPIILVLVSILVSEVNFASK